VSRGGHREGAGRPPGTPNKISQQIRESLAPLDQPAIERLKTLIQSQNEMVAIRAIELHLSYRCGRPRYQVEVESHGDIGRITPQDLVGLPKDVLRRLAGFDSEAMEAEEFPEEPGQAEGEEKKIRQGATGIVKVPHRLSKVLSVGIQAAKEDHEPV
jgi:hypothetical protein